MSAKIIPFVKYRQVEVAPRILNFPRVIDFESYVDELTLREIFQNSGEFENEDSEIRCENYHPITRKELKRQLREGNPVSMCAGCDGQNTECPGYE